MRKILSFRHQKLFMDSQSYQYFFQTHYSVFGGSNLSSSLYRFIHCLYSKSISAQKAALMPFVNIKDRLISFQSETGICAAWWKNTTSPPAFSLTTYSFVCPVRFRTVPYVVGARFACSNFIVIKFIACVAAFLLPKKFRVQPSFFGNHVDYP